MDDLTLARQLDTLVAAGLVREQGPGQYAFRHALICDAVYSTLLVKDRKAYHRAIGDTILDLSRDALDERLADLSLHYYQAGEWDAALEYSRRAAERARAMYAPRETIEHLDRALQAARQVQSPLLSTLLRERAQAHETLGDFERAQADYAESFAEAQARHGRRDEWQALVGLGFLWASRDYARTGEYLKQALALARTMDDPHLLGHTLNRLGNWHFNMGEVKQGLELHHEALTLFKRDGDPDGLAETYDLLALVYWIQGNLREGAGYYKQAIAAFRSLNDRRGLSSALANSSLRGAWMYNDLFIPPDAERPHILANAQEALALACEIGWRAGEAYALGVLGALFASAGEYDSALGHISRSLDVSEEIGHDTWILFGHMALANLYLNFLQLDRARAHYERALQSAQDMGSGIFARPLTAALAIVLMRQGGPAALARAEELLAGSAVPAGMTPDSFGQYALENARLELALARGRSDAALQLVNRQMAARSEWSAGSVAAQRRLYHARTLVALGRLAQAQSALEELLRLLPQQGVGPLKWRVHALLGEVYRRRRRRAESRAQFAEACRIVDKMAATTSDPEVREDFRRRAYADIPRGSRTVSPRASQLC